MDASLNRKSVATLEMVPEVGVEPTHPKVHEFESCASANSATPARGRLVYAEAAAMSMPKRYPAAPR